MKYDILLFDADATLLDFEAAERAALDQTFAAFSIPLTAELEQAYRLYNASLWRQLEEGKINKEYVLHHRFQDVLPRFGHRIPADFSFEEAYQTALGEGHELIEGAEETLEALKREPDCRIYIVTNGVGRTQRSRWKACGLAPFTDDLFISEEAGYEKPDRRFFDYVFARIPDFDPARALVIGDSLNSDILGGHQAGLDTCWFNLKGKKNESGVRPTYEIGQLTELLKLVK